MKDVDVVIQGWDTVAHGDWGSGVPSASAPLTGPVARRACWRNGYQYSSNLMLNASTQNT